MGTLLVATPSLVKFRASNPLETRESVEPDSPTCTIRWSEHYTRKTENSRRS